MLISCTDCSQACPLKNCSKESLDIISKNKSVSSTDKGDYIFAEKNPVNGIFIVHSGKVKIFNTGYNEKRKVA